MPPTFYNVISRFDHLISALVPDNISKLNLTDYIKVDVMPSDEDNEETKLTINKNSISIPMGLHFKHGSIDQALVDFSFTSMCSLYKNTMNTFVGKDLDISEAIRKSQSYNNDMLLVAECTDSSRLAVFVEYSATNSSSDFAHVKVYVGGNYILIGGDNLPVIYYNNTRYDLTESSFEHPSLEGDFR
jgi:hypothetical protein